MVETDRSSFVQAVGRIRSMRKFTLLPAVGLALALLALPGRTQAPQMPQSSDSGHAPSGLTNLIQSSPADINAAYAITPQAGLWMICAASYQGESAPELAF